MEATQPKGHYSPRQFATIVGISEGATRLALREHRVSAITGDYGRRWIPEAEICKRFALQLTSPVTQATTLTMLRRNAIVARAELSSDADLIRNAELFLTAANGEPTSPEEPVPDPWASPAPVAERELIAAGSD